MTRLPAGPASRLGGIRLGVVLVLTVGGLTGCQGAPSTVDPVGPRASLIAEIWWIWFGASSAVFVLVMAALLYALFRRRSSEVEERVRREPRRWLPEPTSHLSGVRMVVAGGVVLPIIVLVPLLTHAFLALTALSEPERESELRIQIVGHQFWWTVRYPDLGFVTANEVRVPVGQPVRLELSSDDVIHSFWVPQVMGKHDMTPGHVTRTWIQVDRAGEYWGQCVEYCGIQHAKMAFVLVAETQDEFASWVALQQRPAQPPDDDLVLQGAQVFAREGCITCHVVRYGDAPTGQAIGPDLTHVASRRTIGAGILPNTRGNLAGWVANPQGVKPGNNMPASYLDSESLLAVVAYLESLR